MVSIREEGFKETFKALKKLDAEAPKKLKKIAKDAAEIVAEETRNTAPVRSGLLASKWKAGATAKGADVRATGPVYLAVQTWGYPSHNIEKNLYPHRALDSKESEFKELLIEGVEELVNEF